MEIPIRPRACKQFTPIRALWHEEGTPVCFTEGEEGERKGEGRGRSSADGVGGGWGAVGETGKGKGSLVRSPPPPNGPPPEGPHPPPVATLSQPPGTALATLVESLLPPRGHGRGRGWGSGSAGDTLGIEGEEDTWSPGRRTGCVCQRGWAWAGPFRRRWRQGIWRRMSRGAALLQVNGAAHLRGAVRATASGVCSPL